MGSSKPAVSGALVDINILQINVNPHHAPARQEDTINPAAAESTMSRAMNKVRDTTGSQIILGINCQT